MFVIAPQFSHLFKAGQSPSSVAPKKRIACPANTTILATASPIDAPGCSVYNANGPPWESVGHAKSTNPVDNYDLRSFARKAGWKWFRWGMYS